MSTKAAPAPAVETPAADAPPPEAEPKPAKSDATGQQLDDEEEEGPVAKLKRHLANKRETQVRAKAADTEPSRGPDGKFLSKDKPKDESDDKPAAKEAPKAAEKPQAAKADDKPAADVVKAQEKLEDAGAKVPEQRKDESDSKYEGRLARALLDLKQAKAEALSAREESKASKPVLDAIARLKGDKISQEDLELATGRTFEQLVRDVAQGKAKYQPKANLPPELQSVMDEAKALRDQLKAERDESERVKRERAEAEERAAGETRRQDAFKRETAQIDEYITEEIDKYPNLSALPNAGERALRRWYATWEEAGYATDKKPNLEEFLTSMESSLNGEVNAIFSSERSIRAALANPSTRELVQKLLGNDPQKTPQPAARNLGNQAKAQSEGPTTLSNKVTQEVPALADRKLTPDEEHAAMLERFRSSPFRQTARK